MSHGCPSSVCASIESFFPQAFSRGKFVSASYFFVQFRGFRPAAERARASLALSASADAKAISPRRMPITPWLATLGPLGWPPSPSAPAFPPPPWDHLIDPDTPDGMRSTVGLGDGLPYTLVMSDEFESEGRHFGEAAGDPRWTAVSRNDDTNNNLAYLTPDAVTTRLGALEITATNTGFRDAKYASGSVQGWNKFCLQGGIVDVSYTLPGDPGVPGVWPGIWMMGNLGRATFTLSTEVRGSH